MKNKTVSNLSTTKCSIAAPNAEPSLCQICRELLNSWNNSTCLWDFFVFDNKFKSSARLPLASFLFIRVCHPNNRYKIRGIEWFHHPTMLIPNLTGIIPIVCPTCSTQPRSLTLSSRTSSSLVNLISSRQQLVLYVASTIYVISTSPPIQSLLLNVQRRAALEFARLINWQVNRNWIKSVTITLYLLNQRRSGVAEFCNCASITRAIFIGTNEIMK